MSFYFTNKYLLTCLNIVSSFKKRCAATMYHRHQCESCSQYLSTAMSFVTICLTISAREVFWQPSFNYGCIAWCYHLSRGVSFLKKFCWRFAWMPAATVCRKSSARQDFLTVLDSLIAFGRPYRLLPSATLG